MSDNFQPIYNLEIRMITANYIIRIIIIFEVATDILYMIYLVVFADMARVLREELACIFIHQSKR